METVVHCDLPSEVYGSLMVAKPYNGFFEMSVLATAVLQRKLQSPGIALEDRGYGRGGRSPAVQGSDRGEG